MISSLEQYNVLYRHGRGTQHSVINLTDALAQEEGKLSDSDIKLSEYSWTGQMKITLAEGQVPRCWGRLEPPTGEG